MRCYVKNKKIEEIINKITKFIEQCDCFIDIIVRMEIFDLNFENPEERLIDIKTAEWKMFFNDLLQFTKNYPIEPNSDFERHILIFNKATKIPNKQNISDLKVALHSLKNYLVEELDTEGVAIGIWQYMHKEICRVSSQRFHDGHFADAVECAFKEINTRVKNLYLKITGEEKDGSDLMRRAFSVKTPILVFEDIRTETGKNVQQGYMDIFAGAIIGIRNPKAHQNMIISEIEAVQHLVFASMLMSKIDEAVKFMEIEE